MNYPLHQIYFINGIMLCSLIFALPVKGQISADGTTPTNINQVNNVFGITGGTEADGNLFHSFQEFSVLTGSEAFFNNADTIDNIISRVTGGSISNIDGLIRANGSANLFFINPAGIIFGENASLDIGGSFLGSTATSIVFPEGEFSAIDTQAPPLLTVNMPIGLGFLGIPGKIVNQSRATTDTELIGIGRTFTGDIFTTGLKVNQENTLALVGGELVIDGGNLTANGGRIELGSVGSNSFINIASTGSNLILGYDEVTNFQDISLSPGTIIDTSGEIGGAIKLQGRQISLANSTFESPIFILSDTTREGKGGSISLNASESIKLDGDFSVIATFSDTSGTAGDLRVETRKLSLNNGSLINSDSFFETGQAGDIEINASELLEVIGTSSFEAFPASIATFGDQNVENPGSAGNLTINTQRLLVKDGGQISTTTFGTTQGGNLIITASDIEVIGASVSDFDGFASFITAQTEESTGVAGNIVIETERLTVKDGGFISTSTFSSGKGGDLTVNASDYITLNGTVAGANLIRGSSGLFALADEFSSGDGGDLSVTTGKLIVENGAKISAETFGTGDAGDVTLDVTQLTVRDGGQIRASSLLGNDNSNLERGAGGILSINAQEFVEITGTGFIGNTPVNSSLFTRAEGTGDAGNLNINTPNLTVKDGGEVTAQTSGIGKAGNIVLGISDNITLTGDGSGLFANTATDSTGDGGNILTQVQTPQTVTVRDGATIAVNSNGSGKGGSITFTVGNLTLDNGSITAETASNQGGNITLDIGNILRFENSGKITATAGTAQGAGDGGNIDIGAKFIIAFPNQDNDITANAFAGNGGDIDIIVESIFGLEQRSSTPPNSTNDIDASSEFGLNGNISIDVLEIDPARGLTELTTQVVDASQLIARSCLADGKDNEFVVTGRGGLPTNPNESLRGDAVLSAEWLTLPQEETRTSQIKQPAKPSPAEEIVEAKAWFVGANGNIILTANPNLTGSLKNSWSSPHDCNSD